MYAIFIKRKILFLLFFLAELTIPFKVIELLEGWLILVSKSFALALRTLVPKTVKWEKLTASANLHIGDLRELMNLSSAVDGSSSLNGSRDQLPGYVCWKGLLVNELGLVSILSFRVPHLFSACICSWSNWWVQRTRPFLVWRLWLR